MTMIRKILIVLCLLAVALVGTGYYLLNTPWLLRKVVLKAGQKLPDAVRLRDVQIGRQKFIWPAHFEFSDIKISMEIKGRPLEVACSSLEADVLGFSRERKEAKLWLDSTVVDYAPAQARNIRWAWNSLSPRNPARSASPGCSPACSSRNQMAAATLA